MLPVLACAVVLGCRDLLSSDRPRGHLSQPAAAHTVGVLDCVADVRAGTLACSAARPTGTAGAHAAILGQNQMKMASANVAFDAGTRIFRADVTTQNLLTEAIGTPDGTTVSGVKVFFSSGPTPTSFTAGDTGTVRVENPDGYGNFTAAHQPYFLYSQMLAPNQVSAAKQWQWHLGPTVNTFSFQVKVFAATPSGVTVPDLPPDSVPTWIYDASNLVPGSTLGTGPYPRNIVLVAFSADATREDKQAAVDLVGGRVVGGLPNSGIYYVAVAEDGTAAPVAGAVTRLKLLPQVHSARPDWLQQLEFRRPADGNNWKTQSWIVDPLAHLAHNDLRWGLERIAAPLAWGCSTGNDSTTVAVVDHGFYTMTDIAANATVTAQYNAAGDGVWHGTAVASILSARGNNAVQMSGVAWNADLRLYDYATVVNGHTVLSTAQAGEQLIAAARAGATVINLSSGVSWAAIGHMPRTSPRDSAAADSATVQGTYETFKDAAFRADTLYHARPLLVIAAGNDALDAWWAGVPRLAADMPSRVLVVAASSQGDVLARVFTNDNRDGTHNLVELAAPGDQVGALNRDSSVVGVSGTSFAAPLAAGVATLLRSFDPRLSPSDLKTLIVQGARSSGSTAGPIPLLNAYESLKLAARRPGAPLCGSRVWQANGHVYTQRDTTPGAPGEALFASTAHVTDIQVRHGGRRVEIHDRDGGGYRLFEWHAPGAWTEVPDSAVRYDSIFVTTAPSYHSYYGESHDGDSVAFAQLVGGNYQIHVQHIDTVTYQTLSDAVVASIPNGESGGMSAHECTYRTGAGCYDSVAVGTARTASISLPAFSPAGDSLLVAVSWTTTTVSVGSTYTCPGWTGTDPPQCTDVLTSWSSDGGNLYAIPLHGAGGARVIATSSGAFREIAIADGAGELTTQVVNSSGSGVESYTGSLRWEHGYSSLGSSETCRTEFRPLKNPATVAAFFNECSPAAATFSPNRNPLGAPALGSVAAASGTFPASGRVPRIFSAGDRTLAPLPRRR